MDASQRLEGRLARHAERQADRRPARRVDVDSIIRDMAQRSGIDLDRLTDPAEGDRLLAERDRESRRDRLATQARILTSRIPANFRNATLPPGPAGALALSWLKDQRAARAAGQRQQNLTILGPVGTGKTWIAYALAILLMTQDYVPTTVVTVEDLMANLRPSGGTGLDVDMLSYSTPPVLVLDDFGAEQATEWSRTQLYRLTNDRAAHGRPTIVTSNLDGKTILERYDQRIVERLFGGSALIKLDGPSLRSLPEGF